MKRKFITAIFAVALFLPPISVAGNNANIEGVVTTEATYAGADYIYFQLHNQPTSHPLCQTDYFVIHASTPPDRLNRMLSRLLTAYTTGETVNIGYDNAGDCAHGRIRVHRIG